MKTQSFKDLIVWQKAYALVLETYKNTKAFPRNEIYGLVGQMRRAAISIASNIAEGYGRQHSAEYRQFLSMAYGSLCELETQYMLSIDLRLMAKDAMVDDLLKAVGSMLYRMINPIR